MKSPFRHRCLEFSGGPSPVYMVTSRTSPGHLPENSDQGLEIGVKLFFTKNACISVPVSSLWNLRQQKEVVMGLDSIEDDQGVYNDPQIAPIPLYKG